MVVGVRVKLFSRTRIPAGSIVAVHQKGDGPTVRGAFVREGRRYVELQRHRVEVDGVLVESKYDTALIPVANVALVETLPR